MERCRCLSGSSISKVVPGLTVRTVAAMITALRSPSDILTILNGLDASLCRAKISSFLDNSIVTERFPHLSNSFIRVNGEGSLSAILCASSGFWLSKRLAMMRARSFSFATKSKSIIDSLSFAYTSVKRELRSISLCGILSSRFRRALGVRSTPDD